jgi:nucleoside-diphosphate-sugar epimerase
VLAAASAAQLPPVVNVGRGEAVSARRMVELLIGVSGVDTAVTEEPAPAGTGPETEWQCMDVGLAEQALGWVPRRSLEDSVASLWDAQYAGALHKGAEAHV